MAGAPRSRWVWLLVLIPLVPPLLVWWSWSVPSRVETASISMAGEWQGAVGGAERLDGQGTDWKPIRLPGSFSAQGLSGREVVLRRRFTVGPALEGSDLLFIIGHVRGAVLRAYVNDRLVGVKGEYRSGFVGAESGVERFLVPAAAVRATDNVLALQIKSLEGGRDGITDNRLLLGRLDTLTAWSFQESSVRQLLELGGVLVLVTLIVLVVVLWVLQGPRAQAPLYTGALLVMVGAVVYLVLKSGVIVTALLPAHTVLELIGASVALLGLGMPEFIEAYYLRRTTVLRRANRAISGFFLVASLVLGTTFAGFGVPLYRLYVNWLFVLLLYTGGLAVWAQVKRPSRFSLPVTVALLATIGAGLNDLLGDLDVVYSPRLFTLAVSDLAVVAAAVVLGEFLQMAEENRRLSLTLSERNEALGVALQKAEESARVKSEFLANTSHELRTPLNSIINIPQGLLEHIHEARRARCGACQALFELEPSEAIDNSTPCPDCQATGTLVIEVSHRMDLEPEAAGRLLNSVVASGKHLLAVVNDILDYSKLDAGRMTVHAEPLDVDELLRELTLTMEPVAARAHVSLRVHHLPRPLQLEADRVKLAQVLINLVGNAIKFSDGKGAVTVTPTVTSGALPALQLAVRDEGIGIAPEHQSTIFEGFRQVEGGNTRRFGGTGLGLAISKRLVELHGGTLRVDSRLGQGSTFTVEFPLAHHLVHLPQAPSAKAPVILVIDDEPTAASTASIALRPLQCRVVGVRDPREALERMRALSPRLVVLDIMLPRISGLELLRTIQADPVLSQVPLIVSSALPDNAAAVEAAGGRFLPKPWEPGALLTLAQALLEEQAG